MVKGILFIVNCGRNWHVVFSLGSHTFMFVGFDFWSHTPTPKSVGAQVPYIAQKSTCL